jgi:hypothetical protein
VSTPVAPFGSVELAVMELLVRDYAPLDMDHIGGEMPGTVDPWYVRVDKIPGGRTDSFEGAFLLDIEVFASDYLNAEKILHDIEGLLLAHGYHVVISGGRRWVFDSVFQNSGVADLPWDGGDDTFRLGSTYTLGFRRQASSGSTPAPAPIPEDETPTEGGAAYAYQRTAPAAAVWTIVHNLGYRPGGVRVTADNGNVYFPVAVDLDENTIRLTFPEPITGWAYLS